MFASCLPRDLISKECAFFSSWGDHSWGPTYWGALYKPQSSHWEASFSGQSFCHRPFVISWQFLKWNLGSHIMPVFFPRLIWSSGSWRIGPLAGTESLGICFQIAPRDCHRSSVMMTVTTLQLSAWLFPLWLLFPLGVVFVSTLKKKVWILVINFFMYRVCQWFIYLKEVWDGCSVPSSVLPTIHSAPVIIKCICRL